MKKRYKVYLDAIKCNRMYSSFIRNCDLGIEEFGVPISISFTIEQEPTKEVIDKIIEVHNSTKEHKELDWYFSNVKLNRIELIVEE